MSFRLPPLNTLRLFEAAGRHLSFKKAAEELRVTPSGVSHGIQSLEEWLGVPLFFRTSRGLALTEAGAAYLPCVREALTTLALGSEKVPGRALTGTLSISSAPTFAARWLVPNLPRFRVLYPDIDVDIDTSHRRVEFPVDGIDIAIRVGAEPSPKLDSIQLIQETLFPVCSPNLFKKSGGKIDFSKATLIHVSSISEDWSAWAKGVGLPDLDISRGLRFDTIQMAFEAAVQGLGAAIGRTPLVDVDLAAGRLVKCHERSIGGSLGYWMVNAKESARRPEILAFRKWVLFALNVPKTKNFSTARGDRSRRPSSGAARSGRR